MKNQSTEDYVKGIYKLQQRGKSVGTSALAKHLNVGDGSVTDMLKRLSDKKLIKYTPYQAVDLTELGRRLALKMMRRHRLWEMFLVKYLNYSWHEVHDEAERLEHVMSDEMEQRLDRALGFPKVDPHGDPIPTARGELESKVYTALNEFDVGDRVTLLRMSDDDPALLQYATKIGLSLNISLTVKEKLNFDGSMVVKTGKKVLFISQKLAESIFVQPI